MGDHPQASCGKAGKAAKLAAVPADIPTLVPLQILPLRNLNKWKIEFMERADSKERSIRGGFAWPAGRKQ